MPGGIDQRRFPRARYRCVVKLSQTGESKEISAVTENIGLGGICVFLERGLNIFSPVELELSLGPESLPVKASGTIVWVVRRREFRKKPSFDTGIEFSRLSPEDKNRLEAILDKLAR